MDLSKLFLFNPFSRFFNRTRSEEDVKVEKQLANSQGISQEEIDIRNFINYDYLSSPGAAITYIGIQFEQYFGSKSGRIQKYREMARYPIINDGLSQICDESIVSNSDGSFLALEIQEEIPEHIEEEIRKIWKYLVVDVFNFNERGWEFFRKWIIEAELYMELILNDEGDNIIGIKILPAHTMMPIYEENKISGFMQVNVNSPEAVKGVDHAHKGNVSYANTQSYSQTEQSNIIFDKDQVAYVNFGDYGDNFLDVRGFLETSIRPYNQLKNMEDAMVVHRLVRAPQRRIWNVYVGKMPKGKADEYVRGLIQRYRKKIIYDPETGAMNSAQNVQSLTEDYWFTKDINGNGTSVDTIGGDSNFGEMDDVTYFQENLYKTMMLPKSRWEEGGGQSVYSNGRAGEIQREEIKFSQFVERLQRRFKYILIDPFITLLRLKGIDERYIDYKLYNIRWTKSNLFKEYKELELLESRLGILGSVSEFIYHPEENPTGYFAQEFALRKFFLMNDEEWQWNKELMSKIIKKDTDETPPDEGFGDEGGDMGTEEEPGGFGSDEGPTETPTTNEPTTPEIVGTDAGGEPIPTPESVSFTKTKKDSLILTEWKNFDKKIIEKYKDQSIKKRFKQ